MNADKAPEEADPARAVLLMCEALRLLDVIGPLNAAATLCSAIEQAGGEPPAVVEFNHN